MVFKVGRNEMGEILSLLFLRFVLEKYTSRMFIANKFYHTVVWIVWVVNFFAGLNWAASHPINDLSSTHSLPYAIY